MLDVAMVSVVFLKLTNKPTPTPPSFNCGSNSGAIVELKNYTKNQGDCVHPLHMNSRSRFKVMGWCGNGERGFFKIHE